MFAEVLDDLIVVGVPSICDELHEGCGLSDFEKHFGAIRTAMTNHRSDSMYLLIAVQRQDCILESSRRGLEK
jgi:hypothetical protein